MANRAISSITVDQGQKGAGVTGQEEMHNHPTLYIVSGATMLVLIILTVPLTTIGLTAASLGAGVGAKAWFLSAMPLGAASGLLGAGTLGDNCGRRSVFLWGLVVMAIASVAAAFSTSSLLFILARIVQGLGGAAVLACGLGLLGQVFPDQQSQSKATALWAAGLGAGVACGPIFAGVVGEFAGWSAVYWGVGLLSACLLGLGYFALPATDPSEGRPLDWVGMLLFMGGGSYLERLRIRTKTSITRKDRVSPGREVRAVDWQLEDAGFVVEAAGGLEGVSFVFFVFFAGCLRGAFVTQVFRDSHLPVWHASLGSQNPTT